MKTLCTLTSAILGCLIASSAAASILDFKSLTIDFTMADDARAKAIWSEPEKLNLTTNGLGWDGEVASSRDGWIHTAPLALGLSWRPPIAVSVRVTIHPMPTEFVLNSGQKSTPYIGDVYVRYSPDLRHWSTWQALQGGESQNSVEKQNPGRHFIGTIRVPYSEREQYGRLLSEYAGLDVPWKSDEDAAVRWIVEKDPDFFATQLPFIGYVEFRYEGSFYGGQRITSFNADVSYGISGLHSTPRNRDAYKDRDVKPWAFRAEEGPANGNQPIRAETHGTSSAEDSRR
jgi:hypothetical protein